MEFIADYGPDTPEEIHLKEQIAEIQESYRRAVEPLVKRLAHIRALKSPRIMFIPDIPPTTIKGVVRPGLPTTRNMKPIDKTRHA